MFRSILSESKQQTPVIEGCPVVNLDDSEVDLAYFLKAFYQPEYGPSLFPKHRHSTNRRRFFETAEDIEFLVLAAVLRLSTKYNVKGLRHIALSHLLDAYPTTIDTWDNRDAALPFAPEQCPPMVVMQLVKEFSITSILPTVMYCCSIRSLSDILDGVRWKDSQLSLNPADQRACLIARQTLITAKRRNISSFLNAVDGISTCSNRASCNTGRLRAVFTNKDDSDSCDPLWDSFDWDAFALSVCATCLATSKTSFRNARSALWADIPALFHLPKWAPSKPTGPT